MVAFHKTTDVFQEAKHRACDETGSWFAQSIMTRAFPGELQNAFDGAAPSVRLREDPFEEQLSYRALSNGKSRFENAGLMLDGNVWTSRARPVPIIDFMDFTGHCERLTLGHVVRKSGPVPTSFYLTDADKGKWTAAKAAKKALRSKDGFQYHYAEGALAFPDPLDRPSRTIITSEGGTTPSRTKHVIASASGRLRRLTPDELEELNGFPRGFTDARVLVTSPARC